jgi:hypothetical protein
VDAAVVVDVREIIATDEEERFGAPLSQRGQAAATGGPAARRWRNSTIPALALARASGPRRPGTGNARNPRLQRLLFLRER